MGAAVNALPGGEIVSAMDRGLIEAAEFNNATSDRAPRLRRRVQGVHAAELSPERRAARNHLQQDEIRCTAGQMKAIIANAVEAASQDMQWKAIDRNSQDYITLQTEDKVKFYKTPDSMLKKQLEVYDDGRGQRRRRQTPCSRKSSNRRWLLPSGRPSGNRTTVVSRRMAVRPLLRAEREAARQELNGRSN